MKRTKRTKRQETTAQVTRPPPDESIFDQLKPLVKDLLFYIGAFGNSAFQINDDSELCDLSKVGFNNNIIMKSRDSIDDMIILVHHVRSIWGMKPLQFTISDQCSLRQEIIKLLNNVQCRLIHNKNKYSSKYTSYNMLNSMQIMSTNSNAKTPSNIHSEIVKMLQREYGTEAFTSASNDVGSKIEELMPFYIEARGSMHMMKALIEDYKRSKPPPRLNGFRIVFGPYHGTFNGLVEEVFARVLDDDGKGRLKVQVDPMLVFKNEEFTDTISRNDVIGWKLPE